jgi:prefoldin subunit 5
MAAAEPPPELGAIDTQQLIKGKNDRGIPEVVFIDDVPTFLVALAPKEGPAADAPVPIETAIGAFNELYSKYKMFEATVEKSRASTKVKIPEIQRSLELVRHLVSKHGSGEAVLTQYNLADTVYAQAQVADTGTVCIWLGANVMLEYSYDEAHALLVSSLARAEQKLVETEEDLQLLRNNSITAEVNMARLFNWDVKRRREREGAAATIGSAVPVK